MKKYGGNMTKYEAKIKKLKFSGLSTHLPLSTVSHFHQQATCLNMIHRLIIAVSDHCNIISETESTELIASYNNQEIDIDKILLNKLKFLLLVNDVF